MRLFWILLIVVSLPVKSQSVIKLRGGMGFYDEIAYTDPLNPVVSNSYVQIKPIKYFSIKDFPLIDYVFLAEYEHNQKWSVVAGANLNAGAGSGIQIQYSSGYFDSQTGLVQAKGARMSYHADVPVRKFPIYFSYSLFKTPRQKKSDKSFFLDVGILAGMSFITKSKKYPFFSNTITSEASEPFYDYAGNSLEPTFKTYSFWRNSVGVLGGLNIKFRTTKHEYATLSIIYEQGTKPLNFTESTLIVNNTYQFTNYTYSRGSNLSVRVHFPIFTYNITQKRFYKD